MQWSCQWTHHHQKLTTGGQILLLYILKQHFQSYFDSCHPLFARPSGNCFRTLLHFAQWGSKFLWSRIQILILYICTNQNIFERYVQISCQNVVSQEVVSECTAKKLQDIVSSIKTNLTTELCILYKLWTLNWFFFYSKKCQNNFEFPTRTKHVNQQNIRCPILV